MKESTLLKLALTASVLGLILLHIISTQIDVKDYRPAKLNSNVGEDIRLSGVIKKISDKDGVIFIDVEHKNKVTVVLFTDDAVNLNKGDNVEVIGEVQDYKGENEIIAKRIAAIK
jgi:aspartyl/asparaginyl-tRNA synthetase